MPSGQSIVDLKAGKVTRRDSAGGESLSSSLGQYGFAYAMSGMIWVDSEATALLRLAGVDTGELYLPQAGFFHFGPMPVDSLVIDSPVPYEVAMLFSTLPQTPVAFDARIMDQERFADITTVDAFTPVPFTPTGGTNLAAAFREAELITRGIGAKFFVVDNYGDNSIDVNIQFQEADGSTWHNDPNTTGASATITSGSVTIYEAGVNAHRTRIRARANAAGSQSTVRVTYRGIPMLR